MLDAIEDQIQLPDIPEIAAVRQYEACAHRIVESLPERSQPRYTITLEGSAFTMAMALRELFEERDPQYPASADHILINRDFGKRAIALCRRMLWRLKDRGRGNPADIGVAFELLERIEPAFWREDLPIAGRPPTVDLSSTCDHVDDMSVMIQVRNVPDELHRQLKARAAMEGLSLSDYILRELRRAAEYPTPAELKARILSRTPVLGGPSSAELIRQSREERDGERDRD